MNRHSAGLAIRGLSLTCQCPKRKAFLQSKTESYPKPGESSGPEIQGPDTSSLQHGLHKHFDFVDEFNAWGAHQGGMRNAHLPKSCSVRAMVLLPTEYGEQAPSPTVGRRLGKLQGRRKMSHFRSCLSHREMTRWK